jgi:hypothetical protein
MYENELASVGLIYNGKNKHNKWNSCGTEDKPKSKNGRYYITDKVIFYYNWRLGTKGSIYIGYTKLYCNFKIPELPEVILKPIKIYYNKCNYHSYLDRKQCIYTENIYKNNDTLIIPLYKTDGLIYSIQYITKDGNKFFSKDKSSKGLFHRLTKYSESNTVLLCEGYATGNAIHQCTDLDVYCCMSLANIWNVYRELKEYCNPIIVKDNDAKGRSIPIIGFTVGNDGEDFNDYFIRVGKCQATTILQDRIKKMG